jgi:hypothetical protein
LLGGLEIEMKIELDLDKIEVGDWNESIANIIRDEIKLVVHSEIRRSLKDNPDLKKAIKVMQQKAAESLLGMVSK